MRKLRVAVLSFILCFIMAGCDRAQEVDGKVTEAWVFMTNGYCSMPESVRGILRADINKRIAPREIKITCETGGTET